MREIKFRAYDKKSKMMASWEEIDQMDEDGLLPFLEILRDENWEKEQYTGLKDKNGKEIYEGDIIKGDEPDFICKCIGVVCFKGISFVIKGKQLLTTEQQNDHCNHSGEWFFTCTGNPQTAEHILEVIGNIHENPELLTNYI